MVRRSLLQLAYVFLALLVTAVHAQTVHTFTFGKFDVDSYTGMVTGCASWQTLDGQPSNQAIGFAGGSCVPYNDSPWWGEFVPQSWGFPNLGDLSKNTTTPPKLDGPFFIDPTCTLTKDGCVDYYTGTANYVGYGTGVTQTETVWFQVHKHIGRYGRIFYSNDETNGSGTTSYTPPTTVSTLYRCGANRGACLR